MLQLGRSIGKAGSIRLEGLAVRVGLWTLLDRPVQAVTASSGHPVQYSSISVLASALVLCSLAPVLHHFAAIQFPFGLVHHWSVEGPNGVV